MESKLDTKLDAETLKKEYEQLMEKEDSVYNKLINKLKNSFKSGQTYIRYNYVLEKGLIMLLLKNGYHVYEQVQEHCGSSSYYDGSSESWTENIKTTVISLYKYEGSSEYPVKKYKIEDL